MIINLRNVGQKRGYGQDIVDVLYVEPMVSVSHGKGPILNCIQYTRIGSDAVELIDVTATGDFVFEGKTYDFLEVYNNA